VYKQDGAQILRLRAQAEHFIQYSARHCHMAFVEWTTWRQKTKITIKTWN